MESQTDLTTLPVQLRGGSGFRFENQVAASFLAGLLLGERQFLPSIEGRILTVDWQSGAPPLDDLRLTLEAGPAAARFSISIKSDRQVTSQGFPDDFVRADWLRWLRGKDRGDYSRERDFLGLVVGELANAVHEAWNNLLRQAQVGDPDVLVRRFSESDEVGEVGRVVRALFQSLQCPEDLPGADSVSPTESVLLLRRIRLLHFDFGSDPSSALIKGVDACRRSLATGDFKVAIDLWQELVGIADERRPLGGHLDLAGLLGRLRGRFHLVSVPDHCSDWERLNRASEDSLDKIKTSLGRTVSLLRPERLREVAARLAAGRQLLLVGTSGAGKSALAKITCRRWHRGPVLWLDAPTADVPGLFALGQRLQLRNPLEELLRDIPGSGLLILDALENWSSQALALATKLLELCGSLPNWSVIMTVQPGPSRQLLPKLQTGMSPSFEPMAVLPLDDDELREAGKALPRLSSLFLRRDLVVLLRNLKVLDWLASDFASGPAPETSGWIKISEVIDGLWQHWIGRGEDSRLRGEVLKNLALREAERLRAGVGLSELGPEELKALARLEEIELLRVQEEHAFFQHDLTGDWARLRILVERAKQGSLASDLAGFARSPRWLPAIRLYGERLLERETVPSDGWSGLYDELPEETAANDVRGVLLESLFWAGNPDKALETLWPKLIADKGKLLQVLLRRFLYSATVPDPQAVTLAGDDGVAAGIRVRVRIPYWPLWKPVLLVLDRHRDDVAALAPDLGAEVCALWLRTMPREFLWRKEAARVALRIAEEAQRRRPNGGRHRGDQDEKRYEEVYEAALWGARDLPDQVSDLALELSRRKGEPPKSRKPSRRARRSRFGSIALLDGWKWPPFPDGPRREVDTGFRKAVLGTQALSSLVECRPKVAQEVLLACCLRAPGIDVHPDSFGTVDHFGWQGVSPPMFFQGPFLRFLQQNAEDALTTILRLVNQATANWTAVRKRGRRSPAPTTGEVAEWEGRSLVPWGEMAHWEGDVGVYGWYRQHHSGPPVVTSALMALEKWLYDLLDEGHEIDAIIARIFAESRSVAFAGLLVALGKKSPNLLAGPLLPLLSAWPLYRSDRHSIDDHEFYRTDLPDFVDFGERIFEMVRSWHLLPHRRVQFLQIALELLLRNSLVAVAFDGYRERWREQLRSETFNSRDELEQLLVFFDRANYPRPEVSSFVCPPSLREKNQHELAAVGPDLKVASFTESCRAALQDRPPFTAEESEQIWESVVEVDRLAREREGFSSWTDGLAAGITVLLDLNRDWIAAYPERIAWCRERIASILNSPPRPDILDGSDIPILWQWPSFVAISGVLLLARDVDDPLAASVK